MITVTQFLKMVADAPDEVLMKSVLNCHAMDVSSIVIEEDEDGLSRMFLAWPNHELFKNSWCSDKLIVGIHNHRYDLILSHFLGYVRNRIFTGSNHARGELYEEYSFVSGVESGSFEAVKIGNAFLECVSDKFLDDSVFMDSCELHTISARGVAAWMVDEQNRNDSSTTQLFTNGTVENNPQMYQRFRNADEVRSHCVEFINVARKSGVIINE